MAERPVNHPDPKLSNLNWDWREVIIRDARKISGGATLKQHGFTILSHNTAVKNWDGAGWQDQFTREVLEIIQRATGASEVAATLNSRRGEHLFTMRSSKVEGAGRPVAFCHNDYTAGSAPCHLAADYPDRAQALFKKRFAIYNVWHLVSPPPQSHPLAVCDATSVAAADIFTCQAYGAEAKRAAYAENAMFRYNPAHRWYYYPDLRNDETLIWCGYDSDASFPSIVPHAAFQDPRYDGATAQRTSVDGAVYAFFD
jgi:hypothetical protein